MAGHRHDVLAPVGQGRQRTAPACNAIVKIAPEGTARFFFPEITVGSADKSKVRLLPNVATDPLINAFLYHSQQLRLQCQRQLADFVQKKSPAIGQRECAFSRRNSGGESTALVTKEFAAR
jgi:hypothetical protein